MTRCRVSSATIAKNSRSWPDNSVIRYSRTAGAVSSATLSLADELEQYRPRLREYARLFLGDPGAELEEVRADLARRLTTAAPSPNALDLEWNRSGE